MSVRQWMTEHKGEAGGHSELAKAAVAAGIASDCGRTYRLAREVMGVQAQRSNPPPPQAPIGKPAQTGMTRAQAQGRYDTPLRISQALQGILDNLPQEGFLEDNEVRRACRVGRDDEAYWTSLTAERQFAAYSGYTETNVRLWGRRSEVEWAASTDGITGFRPAA